MTFVTLGAGRSTIIERVRKWSGEVERYQRIDGSWGVPGAAYDGSTTGASARTLVLEQLGVTYPAKTTRLVVLDTVRLRPLRHIALPGLFTVDAISPDGRWVYLIHYKSIASTADYEVRVYDLATRSLVPEPIVDPREPDEKMQGFPILRTMSSDGRWAYTLYQRPQERPFIHALDTQGRRAFCVDLPKSANDGDLRLALGGGVLRVIRDGVPVALVNTTTFAVKAPPPAKPKPQADRAAGSGFPWEFGVVPVGAALVALALGLRRRQLAAS